MPNFFNKYPYTDFHELNLDWVLETVKRIAAEWAETLEEWHNTQEEWQQLYDYVHDYFDNLDVQEEINNKIDAMADDGTLVTLLTPVISSVVADNISPVVADQIDGAVAGQIGGAVALQINGAVADQISGPVADWLDDHITQPTTPAIDTSLTVAGAAADAKAVGDIFTDLLKLDNAIDLVGAEADHFIYYLNGTSQAYAGMVASPYIEVAGKCAFILSLMNSNPSTDARGLAFYDLNKTFISGIQYQGTADIIDVIPENARYMRCTVTNDCVSTALFRTGATTEAIRYAEVNSDELTRALQISNMIDFTDSVNDKFVIYYNGKIDSLNTVIATKFIRVPGNASYYIEGMSSSSATDSRGLAFYDEYQLYISGVQYTGTTSKSGTIPANAAYLRMTVSGDCTGTAKLIIGPTAKSLITLQDSNMQDINVLTAFNNICCIGDSLTDSQVWTGSSTVRDAYCKYPEVITKKIGVPTHMVARSGYSAKMIWNSYSSSIVARTNQLTIIYLGTNEGLTDTLATDAPTGQPYSTWADTNTGDYAKIIAKSIENGSRVVLVKVWSTSGTPGVSDVPITNSVIDQMGTRFDCAVINAINLPDMKYHYYPDLSGYNGMHFNDLGYSAFADKIMASISALDTDQMKLIIPA